MHVFHKWQTLNRRDIDKYARGRGNKPEDIPYKKIRVIAQSCETCGKEVVRQFTIS